MADESWMRTWPEIAAFAAGAAALAIRANVESGPRPWRVVMGDAFGTVALGWLIFHGAMGVLNSPGLSFALAGFGAAVGWEAVRRVVLPAIQRRMGG